ncbi:MAG: hypothetical protein U5L45_04305 [Saprospiraceae bacterium]|nr:hypothetical protein [Saprospiraceae bacterium]
MVHFSGKIPKMKHLFSFSASRASNNFTYNTKSVPLSIFYCTITLKRKISFFVKT